MRPVTDLQAQGRALRGHLGLPAFRRPADRDRATSSERIHGGEQDVVLLGATGTGKTATVAWAVERLQRPDAGHAAQQDAGRAVRQRAAPAAAQQRGGVLRLLLRLLPARGLRPADRHLHREGLLDQRGGRAAAALGDQLAAHPPRRHRGLHGLLHLRPRHPAGVRRPHGAAPRRRARSTATRCCAGSWRSSTPATTSRSPAAPSGSAATPSRSSRSTRSTRSASRCSGTRSSG